MSFLTIAGLVLLAVWLCFMAVIFFRRVATSTPKDMGRPTPRVGMGVPQRLG
nr:MAG TPA: hypothetical protein [Caudoviricetes sp.]